MKIKIKKRRKTLKTKYIFAIFIIMLIFLSTSYAYFSSHLVVQGRVSGTQEQFSVLYYRISNPQNYPSTIGYMSTYTNTFAGSPSIQSVSMGGNVLTLNDDYTYSGGTLTIPNVTGNIVIEGDNLNVHVTFDVDGITNTVTLLEGETATKPSPDPTKSGYGFLGWVDSNDVLFDFTTPITSDITLYAKFVQGVAEVNGTVYPTLQDAINAVPKNDVETTVRLLANVSENITVANHQNISFDLQNYTISITSGAILTNNGTVKISNGTLTSSSVTDGAINNNSTGHLIISGGRISMTNTKGKQAIYNNNGVVEIKDSAYISSASSAPNSNARAAVQNLASGTLRITGGTIVSTGFQGVNNAGTMIIGTEDNNPDKTTPVIQAATDGINSTTNYSFYNGIVKGASKAVNNKAKITNYETGYNITNSEEVINGTTYQTLYLAISETITFDPNGGTLSETTRSVENGMPIGTLPVPTRTGYVFDGWYTLPQGGTEITASTIVTHADTYYAQWTKAWVAEVNGMQYDTLQAAINTVSTNNTETTVKLLRNTSEAIKTKANQNIKLNLQNYTLSNSGTSLVIENFGTLTIYNGTLTSNNSTIINNNSNAHLKITGGNLIATGTKQAVYNYGGGTVEISGDAYLCSSSTGTPPKESTLERATVQNLVGGNIIITGGTIVGTVQQAVSNDGTITLGTQDGSIDTTKPVIIGETCGLKSLGTINFYDGIIKGITGGITGTISNQEANSQVTTGSESIDGKTYITEYLQ